MTTVLHNPWSAACSRNGAGEPTREHARCVVCQSEPGEPAAAPLPDVEPGPLIGWRPVENGEERVRLTAPDERAWYDPMPHGCAVAWLPVAVFLAAALLLFVVLA